MTPPLGRTCLSLVVTYALAAGCGSSMMRDDGGGSTGSAGTTGVAGSTGTGGTMQNCGDPNLAVDPTALIDDMEAGSSTSLLGGGSGWWAGGDEPSKAMGASITPDGIASPELIPGGRCGSKRAIHVTGQGFTVWAVVNVSMGWGAVDGGMGLLPRDVSFRDGITFWARVGDTSTNQVRLNLSDQYSNDMGHICDPTQATGPTACYDHFGTALGGLDTAWKQFKVPFGGLGQRNFGIQRDKLDTTHLYSIDFDFPPGAVFDFWLDDISWY